MRSYKAVLDPPGLGARVDRPRYGHYFFDEGLVGAAFFRLYFVAVDKKGLAHLRKSSYEKIEVLVCETLYISKFSQ